MTNVIINSGSAGVGLPRGAETNSSNEVVRMLTPKQISTATQQSQVQTKVVSGLKCPDCREKSVKVKLVRGSIVAGSAKCQSCGWAGSRRQVHRWHCRQVSMLRVVRVSCFGLAFGQATFCCFGLRPMRLGRKRNLHASSRHFVGREHLC